MGGSYWLYKAAGSDEIQLFEVLWPGAPSSSSDAQFSSQDADSSTTQDDNRDANAPVEAEDCCEQTVEEIMNASTSEIVSITAATNTYSGPSEFVTPLSMLCFRIACRLLSQDRDEQLHRPTSNGMHSSSTAQQQTINAVIDLLSKTLQMLDYNRFAKMWCHAKELLATCFMRRAGLKWSTPPGSLSPKHDAVGSEDASSADVDGPFRPSVPFQRIYAPHALFMGEVSQSHTDVHTPAVVRKQLLESLQASRLALL